jgi:uncharacterized protein YPO0396
MRSLFDDQPGFDAPAAPGNRFAPATAQPEPVAAPHAHQFRLQRLQTFNWGTFGGLFDFAIPAQGYLFVGPSGSGKSTLLDAHAALLTPPKWVDFNVAARENERQGKDRNLLTYLRGAWAQQSGEGREVVAQVLRPDTTWSAIAETYRNGEGRLVVLAQVLWVRGKSNQAADVQRLYLVLQEPLELAALEFFPRSDFDVRRFKHDLPQAFLAREFSAYQERFRGLLGIASERALRLLHKTQSAKNLGDLNTFLRDFMLDAPETFTVADRLVLEFGELNAAHQAVVAARRQIETLAPAEAAWQERLLCGQRKATLAELQAGVDGFREQWRSHLLGARIAELRTDAEGAHQQAAQLAEVAEREFDKLGELKRRRADSGGQLIEDLQRQLADAERARPERARKRELARAACATMGWAMPDAVAWFVQRVDAARTHVQDAAQRSQQAEARKDALKRDKAEAEQRFTQVVREVRAMERQRSNIPARLLDLRARIAQALGLAEERLPFAGELLQVRADQAAWQGAIERVLGGFARALLVDDRHYAAVTAWLEDNDTGERLFYNRMLAQAAGNRTPGPHSLVRKLDTAPGLAPVVADWLREELKVHFDFECAESLQAFRAASRAVTRQGQVKRDSSRHEKNDRQRIDDRSQWVLGFDNRDKLRLYQEQAASLAETIAAADRALAAARNDEDQLRAQDMACNTLQNLSWADIDVASLVALAADLQQRIAAELAARPDLATLDAQIRQQDKAQRAAAEARTQAGVRAQGFDAEIARLEGRLLVQARLPAPLLTQAQQQGLDERLKERLAERATTLALDNLDQLVAQIDRALGAEDKALELQMLALRNAIEQRLAEFNRLWPAEAGGLDPSLAAAEDYFGKLTRLQTDGLPQHEQRFMQLLREQSDQNLTLLASKIDQERSAIRARMELVNESLLGAPFNTGTHLVIDTLPREGEEVRAFRQRLRDALSHSLSAGLIGDAAVAEQRFALLDALVKRLASQEPADRHWRALVLDVRQHVEFMARELQDDDGREIEVYRSGAGKSGGQRQKLTATCLAAALRYQLGGRERAWPGFATVVLDEAFDKADAEFTAMAMNIFNSFGFQMVVATPLKSVMTLEPFIGGACYIHNSDRQHSSALRIDYDTGTGRLNLPQALVPDTAAPALPDAAPHAEAAAA